MSPREHGASSPQDNRDMAPSQRPEHAPPAPLPAPDPVDHDLEPLLSEPFASGWAAPGSAGSSTGLRGRLLGRAAVSRAASASMTTVRWLRAEMVALNDGVTLRRLYAAPSERALRPGEPLRSCLVELAPGTRWAVPAVAHSREWLVLRGSVQLGAETLLERDYRFEPAGADALDLGSSEGAMLFLRESSAALAASAAAFTVRDAEAGWPDFAPGIRRRVLWQHGGQAALLYHAEPGAVVPNHRHGHDEECLMVQGELFLDDVLLRQGDYQLAPAGGQHHVTQTDTGAILFAHGDLDLDFTD